MEKQMIQIGLTGMTIVLGLLFSKIGVYIAGLSSSLVSDRTDIPKEGKYELIGGVAIIVTILVILTGMILTILEANYGYKFSYGPAYFIISLLLITFPLYVAIECVSKSMDNIYSSENHRIDSKALKLGILFLRMAFYALLAYLLIVLLFEHFEITSRENWSGIDHTITQKFVVVGLFHLGGIIYSHLIVRRLDSPLYLMSTSIFVLVGSIVYLIMVWGVKVEIQNQYTTPL